MLYWGFIKRNQLMLSKSFAYPSKSNLTPITSSFWDLSPFSVRNKWWSLYFNNLCNICEFSHTKLSENSTECDFNLDTKFGFLIVSLVISKLIVKWVQTY